jgi:hypothetical protein
MTLMLSKRQQARNEKALQELIKTVPGNDKCADCGAWNPGMLHLPSSSPDQVLHSSLTTRFARMG